jgi:hypothetical protein
MSVSARRGRMALTRMATVVAFAAALAAPVACMHRGEHNPSDDEQQAGPTTVQVVNQGFADMTIYVVSDAGQRIRLGLATGNSTQTFTIPRSMVNGGATPIRFLADPIGGTRSPVSDQLTVSPGDNVVLTIPPA